MPTTVKYLSTRQVCSALDISYSTFRKYIDAGKLAAVRINGRDWRVSEEAIRKFMGEEITRSEETKTAA